MRESEGLQQAQDWSDAVVVCGKGRGVVTWCSAGRGGAGRVWMLWWRLEQQGMGGLDVG